jgi:hypothetical protein
LNISFKVVWAQGRNHDKHGFTEECSRTIFLFDKDEKEAWLTLEHEILELRLKTVTDVYCGLSNSWISFLKLSGLLKNLGNPDQYGPLPTLLFYLFASQVLITYFLMTAGIN